MFRKMVEKYRLGLKMVADGYSPREVKGLLEYANDFRIRGKIPHDPKPPFESPRIR